MASARERDLTTMTDRLDTLRADLSMLAGDRPDSVTSHALDALDDAIDKINSARRAMEQTDAGRDALGMTYTTGRGRRSTW